MNVQVSLMTGAMLVAALCGPAALADSYSSVTTTTTQDVQPVGDVQLVQPGTYIETAPAATVIREQPVILTRPADREVVVIKQHHHHLIHIGPVKVF